MPRRKFQKYRNTRCIDEKYDTGIKFDSMHERKVWYDLKELESRHLVEIIELQKTFKFYVNGYKVCAMRADFIISYDDVLYVLDAKSAATQGRLFEIKKTLLKALHGHDVYSITNKFTIYDLIDELDEKRLCKVM